MLATIEKLPRIKLGLYPTPLTETPHLSSVLGGPRIFFKRDDLSGLAMGGNKCRKLEFALGKAKKEGINAVISTASSQSNWCLQLAAAARKVGMKPAFILLRGAHAEIQGNLLLHNILDSTINILEIGDMRERSGSAVIQAMNDLAEDMRTEGYSPCIMPTGIPSAPSDILGSAGWVNAADELITQLEQNHIEAQYVVLANGDGGTQAGLELGSKYLNASYKIIGISILNSNADAKISVMESFHATSKFLNLGTEITADELEITDKYVGAGYGLPTREGMAAIKLVAQTEGIYLDPVYTGKAMAGLIDLIRKGRFKPTETVIFIHTGGIPALFAYHQEMTKYTCLSFNDYK
jgi:L-cysteate sulfo-lyase